MRLRVTALKGGGEGEKGQEKSVKAHPRSSDVAHGITRKRAVQILYFLVFSALACQGRFLSLFFRDSLGLTNQQIGPCQLFSHMHPPHHSSLVFLLT